MGTSCPTLLAVINFNCFFFLLVLGHSLELQLLLFTDIIVFLQNRNNALHFFNQENHVRRRLAAAFFVDRNF